MSPRTLVLSATLAAALGLSARAARAQGATPAEPPPSVAVDDDPALAALVEEALRANPDLAAARAEAEAARAVPAQARALPDPMLSVGYENDGLAPSLGEMPMTRLFVMGSQDLPWPGTRRLRGEVADRTADAAAQRLERARLSVAADVRRAYATLRQARSLLGLVREQSDLLRQIEGVARARYAVGEGAQPDVLRMQVEVTRIGQAEAEQKAEETARVAELNRLLGRAAAASVETPEPLAVRPVAGGLAEAMARLETISPELRAARMEIERARTAVALAQHENRPSLTVQGGYMNRGRLDPMWQAGVGVTLPVWGAKRAGRLAEAEALARAAEQRAASAALQLRYRTQERLAQLQAAETTVRLYDKGVVPQDRMAVEAALANYRTGRVPFVAVLEALTTLYADRSTQIRLTAGHARARASLDEATLGATADLPGTGMAGVPGTGTGAGTGTGTASMGSMGR